MVAQLTERLKPVVAHLDAPEGCGCGLPEARQVRQLALHQIERRRVLWRRHKVVGVALDSVMVLVRVVAVL